MKELLLFTKSQALANHWVSSIEDSYKIVKHASELYPTFDKTKSQIILFDMQSFASLFDMVIAEASESNVALFALSGLPLFEEGSLLLPVQVAGYGNAYMSAPHLQQALEVIREGKVWLYPEFVQELISQAAHKPTLSRSVSTEDLTAKELEVSQLVALGKTNKEVASSLGITERTVKAHLTHIYEKLQVHDRLSLALLFKESK